MVPGTVLGIGDIAVNTQRKIPATMELVSPWGQMHNVTYFIILHLKMRDIRRSNKD